MAKGDVSGKAGGYLALTTTCILWGTTWVASKIGIAHMPALQMAYIRQLLAGICFLLFFFIYKKVKLPTLRQFGWLLLLALLMFVFANGLSTYSLKYIPTGMSALIGALYPLSVVLIERYYFKDRNMTPLTFLGLILGIAGIGIVFFETAFHQHHPLFFVGILLSFIAMISWSIGTMIVARDKLKMDAYYATGWQMLLSAGIMYVMSASTNSNVPLHQIPLRAWLVIGYLVVAGSLISFAAFIYSMKKLAPAISSLYAYINPLVAMLVAAMILNEPLNMNIFWGALVTLIGVFIVNYSIRKKKKGVNPEPVQ